MLSGCNSTGVLHFWIRNWSHIATRLVVLVGATVYINDKGSVFSNRIWVIFYGIVLHVNLYASIDGVGFSIWRHTETFHIFYFFFFCIHFLVNSFVWNRAGFSLYRKPGDRASWAHSCMQVNPSLVFKHHRCGHLYLVHASLTLWWRCYKVLMINGERQIVVGVLAMFVLSWRGQVDFISFSLPMLNVTSSCSTTRRFITEERYIKLLSYTGSG